MHTLSWKTSCLFINLCTTGRVRNEMCLAPAPSTCIRKLLSGCLEVHLLLLGIAAFGGLKPVSHTKHCQGPRVTVAGVIRYPCGKQAAGGDDFQSSDIFTPNDLWHTKKRGCTIYQELFLYSSCISPLQCNCRSLHSAFCIKKGTVGLSVE